MKKIFLIVISISSIFLLTGCYDKKEVNNVAYVVSIGIDKSEIDPKKISVTFEFVLPLAVESESSLENKTSTYTTIEASSLYTALNLVNSYISKEINLSHNKLIVFSEEMAINGISEYTSTLAHDRNFRSNMYILISKCKAKDYIENTSSIFEKNPAKFYDLLFDSYEYTSFSDNSLLNEYIIKSFSNTTQPTAMLGNISITPENNEIDNADISFSQMYQPSNANYVAGNIPKKGGPDTELIGLSVFRYSKLVGELTGEETLYYLISNNTFKECNYSICDPLSTDKNIDFKLSKKNNTDISVTMIDGVPLIKLKANINANILSINLDVNYMNKENLEKLEHELEYILKQNMRNYLYKTAKEFRSDISGFGNKASKNYLTWDKWEESNWLDIYQFSYFDVEFNVNIDKTGLVFID